MPEQRGTRPSSRPPPNSNLVSRKPGAVHGVYRLPHPANDDDPALLRWIDEMFTRWPFLGSRRMTAMLRAEGQTINRKRVQRLMRRMGIADLGPRPRTTKSAPGHRIYPYLLRDVTVKRPNQVWA